MFTKQFWKDTAERMVRGGANVVLVRAGVVVAADRDSVDWEAVMTLPGWFAAGMIVPLCLSLIGGRREGTISPAGFTKP